MVLQASFRSFLVMMNPELGISLKPPFKVRSSEVARILGPVICQKNTICIMTITQRKPPLNPKS